MTISRRTFVKAGMTMTAVATLPRPLLVRLHAAPEPPPPIHDPRLKELVARALDAARTAGAAYADARLTHDRFRGITAKHAVVDAEELTVGVRALVHGYWGFASGPVWSPDEMARLGREAVAQAKTNALGKTRVVELAPTPVVPDGHWEMPVKIDPFTVPPLEIADFLASLNIFVRRTPDVFVPANRCDLFTQERAFGSTEGSYCTQRVYRTTGEFAIGVQRPDGRKGAGALDTLSPAGVGWELYHDQPLRESIHRLIEEVKSDMALPVKPVDVGRYDVVLDAMGVANVIDQTLGYATELDRALGYEANAGGTSYVNDPLTMLGTYQAGVPLLNVNAERSVAGGCATVKWDDEGVAPEDFPLVKDGVLVDFQTTREGAGWLKGWYAAHGRPFRSHGCAAAPTGGLAPMSHLPNLAMVPGLEALDFDALVAGLGDGIAVKGFSAGMDFQHLNGIGGGRTYEVKRGKRTAVIAGAGLLFRAPELWKSLLRVGGAAAARRYGMIAEKGEPAEATYHSVTAPPAVFKQLTVIDPLRKA
jgi:TldD protein